MNVPNIRMNDSKAVFGSFSIALSSSTIAKAVVAKSDGRPQC